MIPVTCPAWTVHSYRSAAHQLDPLQEAGSHPSRALLRHPQRDSTRSWLQYSTTYPRNLLSQWLNFNLFGITYLVGKIKFKLFFSGSIGWVREDTVLADLMKSLVAQNFVVNSAAVTANKMFPLSAAGVVLPTASVNTIFNATVCLPTIHFVGLLLLVSGRVTLHQVDPMSEFTLSWKPFDQQPFFNILRGRHVFFSQFFSSHPWAKKKQHDGSNQQIHKQNTHTNSAKWVPTISYKWSYRAPINGRK